MDIGIDIVEVPRIRSSVERTPGLLEKVFSKNEIDYAYSHANPWQRLAARFAAKEALAKALGVGLLELEPSSAELLNEKNGKPYFKLNGRSRELATMRGLRNISVSISHEKTYAVAVVSTDSEQIENCFDRSS